MWHGTKTHKFKIRVCPEHRSSLRLMPLEDKSFCLEDLAPLVMLLLCRCILKDLLFCFVLFFGTGFLLCSLGYP